MSAQYVGLDVALQKTAICVIDAQGQRCWEGVCSSAPEILIATLRNHAPQACRVGLETGPLAVWQWHRLRAAGLPVVCLHARHAKAALSLQLNKTDPNDAYGLAQIVRTGWYREVELKSMASYRLRLLIAARARHHRVRTGLYNQIRGLLKTFGVVLGRGKGGTFERLVVERMPEDPAVQLVVEALLRQWRSLHDEVRGFDRALQRAAREDATCQRLMTIPGVGPLTALAYVATIDDPRRFRHASDVGAYLGLTPRRYQSGAVDRSGSITKAGDTMLRSLLFEAAHVLLTRRGAACELRTWGQALIARAGLRRATVAVARKLAVVMHRVWIDGTCFDAGHSPA